MSIRILVVAAECAPFAKTGGLGDVVGALPKALALRGHDVRVVVPLYAGLPWDAFEQLDGTLIVPMGDGPLFGGVRLGQLPGSAVPVYFLEYHRFFDRPHIYGTASEPYADNLARFTFLSRGALVLCEALGWIPDVAHANDWHTALVPVYLDSAASRGPLEGVASVYAIHNLQHQGVFDPGALPVTGLGWEHLNAGELEHFGTLNLTKGACMHAERLVTVSPTYAQEIRTPALGFGLDGVLRGRGADLVGVLNGIDVCEWDPVADPYLPARFDRDDLTGKAICKAALQREVGLPVRDDLPVFGLVGRLVQQKGIDVLVAALDRMLRWDLQLVVLGTGDADLADALRAAARRHGDRLAVGIAFDEPRAHRIEAGADFFLMPSRFEPCGLNQLYSLRYGTLPIVRATGGLADTVVNYDQATGAGTGFVFHDLTPGTLADTVAWALDTWVRRPAHVVQLRREAMAQDFSWDRAAAAYEAVYRAAVAQRRGRA